MTNDELRELNKNRKLVQIGFFVKDLKKAMDKWINELSIGPFILIDLDENNTKEVIELGIPSEEPFQAKVAVAFVGDMQIELIQPCFGVHVYEDWINKHGESFSHIKEFMPSIDRMNEEVDRYVNKGIPLIRGGNLYGDVHRYLDFSDTLGLIWELGNCPEEVDLPDGMLSIYPPEE